MRWIALLLLQVCLSQAATYVIAAGVEQYDDPQVSRLTYAVADARSVASAFRASGVPPKNVIVLTSDVKDASKRPTRINLLRAFGQVKQQATVDDKLVFFFAGHGVERNGEHYLLGSDTQRDLLEDTALPMTLVNKALDGLACSEVLFVIDACRNDPKAGRGDADAELSEEFARGLRPRFTGPQAKPQLVATLLACDAGQRAWESPEDGHGVFSLYLVKALSGQAAGENGQVTLSSLAEYVSKEVASWAARSRREQRPRLVNPDGGDMIVLTAPPEPVVSVAFQNHSLAQVVDLLAEQFGAEIVLGPGADATLAVTGRLDNQPLGTVLKVLVAAHGLTVRREGKIYIIEGKLEPVVAPLSRRGPKAWHIENRQLVDSGGAKVFPLAAHISFGDGVLSPRPAPEACAAVLASAGVELVWLQIKGTTLTNGDPGDAFASPIEDLDALVAELGQVGIRIILLPQLQPSKSNWVTMPEATLWSAADDQRRYLKLMSDLAARYRDQGEVVVGLGLLSDPEPPTALIWQDLTRRVVDAIRSADPEMPLYLTPPFNFDGTAWSELLPDNALLGGWLAGRAYPGCLRTGEMAMATFEAKPNGGEAAQRAAEDRLRRGVVPVLYHQTSYQLAEWVASVPPEWASFRQLVEQRRGYGSTTVVADRGRPANWPVYLASVEPPAGMTWADFRVRARDGMPQVLVPAGEFLMGSPEGVGNEDEHPQRRIRVSAFWMDVHPVTWAQYARFASATGRARPLYQMLTPADLQPVVAVTWQEAQDYATWAGAGLPTEAQYERAARGNIEGASYPWGESFAPELANMLAKQGEQPAVRPLTLVTDFPPNGFGLLDICGNAYSWCRDTYDPHWYAVMPDHDPCNTVDGPKRVRRGGCWNFWPEVGRCANRGCLGWEDFTAETRGENTGFRCVQSAD